jgi:hypothetical protein
MFGGVDSAKPILQYHFFEAYFCDIIGNICRVRCWVHPSPSRFRVRAVMKDPNVITHPTGWWPPRTVETTLDEVLERLGRSQARVWALARMTSRRSSR